ncbi:MAG TPA: hypothetical protein VEK74_12965 [Burkholderiaceae bacterium]|nr:hypothetical protein [Burkholderiaceae bacterium]
MLQIFLQSLLIGALLATALFIARALLRRAAARREQIARVTGALRCIRPLDLGEH